MRIVGGKWKGRLLKSPSNESTRPTQDRVREALVSQVLAALELSLEDVVVLDAFAGTGAVGLELLSRGAHSAYFAEKNPSAWRILSENVRALDAKDAHVYRGTVSAMLEGYAGKSFSLVFLDPPYADDPEASLAVLETLFSNKLLSDDAIIIHERDQRAPALKHVNLELKREKRYASSYIALYKIRKRRED